MPGERMLTIRVTDKWVKDVGELQDFINSRTATGPKIADYTDVTMADLVFLALEAMADIAPPERSIGYSVHDKFRYYRGSLRAESVAGKIGRTWNLHKRRLRRSAADARRERMRFRLIQEGEGAA